jgi:predicted dehydrogenase
MTLRAAVIGLGQMGRHHVRVLSAHDGVELVGVADPIVDPATEVGRGTRVVGSVAELLELKPDLCVVAAPTELHEEIGLALAEAGVHALIEKPLAVEMHAALRLVQAFQSQGLIGAVGHIERFNPALQALRARLEDGQLGDIFQIATRRQGPFPARIKDVGVVLDLATHDIDLTAWVAHSSFVSVAARTAHKTGREHEDLVAVTGLLRSGAVTNHLVNWLTPMKERVTVVTGDRGCFVADTLTADLTFYANGAVPASWDAISQLRGVSEGDMVRYAIAKPEPLAVEIDAFIRSVQAGEPKGIVTMEDGLAAVAVAGAVLRSAGEGTTATVNGLGSSEHIGG